MASVSNVNAKVMSFRNGARNYDLQPRDLQKDTPRFTLCWLEDYLRCIVHPLNLDAVKRNP